AERFRLELARHLLPLGADGDLAGLPHLLARDQVLLAQLEAPRRVFARRPGVANRFGGAVPWSIGVPTLPVPPQLGLQLRPHAPTVGWRVAGFPAKPVGWLVVFPAALLPAVAPLPVRAVPW